VLTAFVSGCAATAPEISDPTFAEFERVNTVAVRPRPLPTFEIPEALLLELDDQALLELDEYTLVAQYNTNLAEANADERDALALALNAAINAGEALEEIQVVRAQRQAIDKQEDRQKIWYWRGIGGISWLLLALAL